MNDGSIESVNLSTNPTFHDSTDIVLPNEAIGSSDDFSVNTESHVSTELALLNVSTAPGGTFSSPFAMVNPVTTKVIQSETSGFAEADVGGTADDLDELFRDIDEVIEAAMLAENRDSPSDQRLVDAIYYSLFGADFDSDFNVSAPPNTPEN